MSQSHDLSVAEIDRQEAECFFDSFNADIAFELGCALREAAKQYQPAVLIQITNTSGVTFFQCSSKPGVVPDNEAWAARKRRTVIHFNRSTFFIGCKMRSEGKTMMEAFKLDESQYAAHGGGFPIRVRGCEGIFGVIVVSGLPQHLDHDLIYQTVRDFIRQP